MHAVALGSLADVERELAAGAALEAMDWWHRTALAIALVTGDAAKAARLFERGASADVCGRLGPALFYAIDGHQPALVRWLLEIGADVDQMDASGVTALMHAADVDDVACADVLIAAGAEVDRYVFGTALGRATSRAMVERLLAAGAGPTAPLAGRTARRGWAAAGSRCHAADRHRRRVRARLGPPLRRRQSGADERAVLAGDDSLRHPGLWRRADVRGAADVPARPDLVRAPLRPVADLSARRPHRADRRRARGFLRSGLLHLQRRLRAFAGGRRSPSTATRRTLFPPTDFHTATLMGDVIVVIGALGYQGARGYGETPVFRLDLTTFRMERLETTGDGPGWIYKHRADPAGPHRIRVRGGSIVALRGGKEVHDLNQDEFVLDVSSGRWSRER